MMRADISLNKLGLYLLILAVGWWLVFQTDILNFWYRLTLLAVLQLAITKVYFEVELDWGGANILWGLVLAVALYVIFWLGNQVSRAIFPQAISQINSVYSYRSELTPVVIAGLLGLVVGPAEEFFWRGLLQTKLAEEVGPGRGYLAAASLYAAVHLWTGNFMLILAALTAGLFWGYWRWQEEKLVPIIISHSFWDILVFILIPFRS